MKFEPIVHRIPRLRETVRNISLTHFTNAIIAFLFAASAPVAIVLGVGVKGDLSEQDIASWLFGAFVINGILGISVATARAAAQAYSLLDPTTKVSKL